MKAAVIAIVMLTACTDPRAGLQYGTVGATFGPQNSGGPTVSGSIGAAWFGLSG